ncbi:hypothetical protein Tco_0835065 [Tanacetum coccineum]
MGSYKNKWSKYQVSTDTNGQIRVLPPKTAEEILARERERKARTTLLMSILEDHLAKFYKMTDAKKMWEAIKSRFGVSTKDANQKFLRSLPASWSQVSLIMRTKPRVDTLSFDDIYNNIRVFEYDVKGSTASSSSTQDVAFVSSESTSNTNDVSTAYWSILDPEDLNRRKLQFDAKELVGFDKTKYESDSDDEYVIKPSKEQEKPSFAFVNTVKHVKTPREIVKEQNTCSPSPKSDKRDWNGFMSKKLGLGYGFTKKACFIYGSFSHLIWREKGIVDSGMFQAHDREKSLLVEYKTNNWSPVALEENIKQFNLFSVSQICEKKNKVLFTDSECLVPSPDFKLPDENQILLRVPRQNNMYSFNLENIVPTGGKGPNWLFDLDYLTIPMNYQPVTVENKANKMGSPKEANHSTAKNGDEKPNGDFGLKINEAPKEQEDQAFLEELESLKRQEKEANNAAKAFRKEFAQSTKDLLLQAGAARATSTNTINTVSTLISTASPSRIFSTGGPNLNQTRTKMIRKYLLLKEYIYENPSDGFLPSVSLCDEGAVADFTNLETTVNVSPIPTSRIYSIHPITHILGDPTSIVQTRSKEELLQFKIPKVWILVDLPFGKKAIRTKWVYRNKKDERGVVVRNKILSSVRRSIYRRGTIDKTLFIKKNKNDIMLVQVYVDDIIFGSTKKSFLGVMIGTSIRSRFQIVLWENSPSFLDYSVKTVSTPIETRSHLTRMKKLRCDVTSVLVPFSVTPKTLTSFMLWKRIFSDYAEANLDRKSTTEGCQFLGRRLISWQWKKQTIVATSTTDAKYIATANCCGQNYGVHTLHWNMVLRFNASERKYPLPKKTLERMISFEVIAESAKCWR